MSALPIRWVTRLGDLADAARFVRRLPRYYQTPIGRDEALRIVRRRLERREDDFLDLVRRTVFENAGSPYRELFRLAGCEEGDLGRLVGQDGVEGALRALYHQGVYLTVDELKGHRPAVRSGVAVHVDAARFRNPLAGSHMPGRTSGSRGTARHVPVDLECLRDRSVNAGLTLDARGGGNWVKGVWSMSTGSLGVAIRFSGFGAPTARCFMLVDPATAGLGAHYRWSARLLRAAALLYGLPLPRAEHVPVSDPSPILRWMAEVLRAGRSRTSGPSSARPSDCAGSRSRWDSTSAAPGSRSRASRSPRAGWRRFARPGSRPWSTTAAPRPGSSPAGVSRPTSGRGPLLPGPPRADPGRRGRRRRRPPRRSAPDLVAAPDRAGHLPQRLDGRSRGAGTAACGCPLDSLGWTTHLHGIRSFEKLTAGGMTFLDSSVMRVLDEVLPARFGGGPTDYQLLEEEGDDGLSRVTLLVHPAIGPLSAMPSRTPSSPPSAAGRGPSARWSSTGAPRSSSGSSGDPRSRPRPERSCISSRRARTARRRSRSG